MSGDDQVFRDVLSSIPNEVRRYSGDVADYIDKHVENLAGQLRIQLSSAQWIPESVRPRPPPSRFSAEMVPQSTYEKFEDWVSRHKLVTGLIVLATGTVMYQCYRRSHFCRKTRRAKRARNGGRLEVVVVAGKPSLPLTKAIALDLERRGHTVYIVCNSVEDDAMVRNMSRMDIKPLAIDIADPPSAGASIDLFAQYLQTPHAPVSKAKANYLTLKAVILVPSLSYQTSPIATIPPSSFADLFNTHLLHPILTIQAFLPLLTARLSTQPPEPEIGPDGKVSKTNTNSPPKVLVFTPSIISSINPPFHAPEATVCSALSAFTEVLTAELRPLSIPVTHVQLGTFDFASFTPSAQAGAAATARAALMPPSSDSSSEASWPEGARHAYGRNFDAQASSATVGSGTVFHGLRGTSLRELHNTVFDIIHTAGGVQPPTVVRIGLGADLYGFVGRWVPRNLVAWMMGVRKVDDLAAWQPASADNSPTNSPKISPKTSPRSVSESGEFIAVTGSTLGDASDSNPWRAPV
ncbi:hypothetical protein MGG_00679 [Pyricularia oryzae 70-15]|uniref:DUF1776 family protein n=1 Tax=Pyricularia oryzae (strain 70-15 / ATCC MYA-4617 / FGSC 8958) TaxID=242507 RepID=G4NAY9_PYRO7|nr:uncharacterized protein MGG_00679 [Pyricularia oryzae 70-15]EHA48751.1 hypothetical protein MGG_00679 [Pyricularia oryzae 70-15]